MGSDVTVVIKSKGGPEVVRDLDKVGAAADGIGSKLGGMAKIGAAALAGIGAAGIGAGVGLFKLGQSFDDAFDTIAIGTGASGKALEGLQGDFKKVFTSVPTDMGKAATAIADLNTRTGATGPALQAMSKQMLEMTRITGGDLTKNIQSVTRLMGDWGVDGPKAMDKLFVASQSTGIGIDTLADQMVKFGAPLRQLGFDFDTSAALLGKFEKEGVNAELVMGSMRIALGKMAKEGEPAQETLNRTVEAIKNAGSASEANALALELFGARAGPDMAAAIREGRFAVDDLVAMMGESEGAVMKTAASTADFGEKWTVAKNKVLTALEPMATAVLGFATTFMEKAAPKIEEFVAWLGPKLSEAGRYFSTEIQPKIEAFIAFVVPKLKELGDQVAEQFAKFQNYYKSDIQPAIDNIKTAVEEVVQWIRDHWGQIEPIVRPIFEQVANIVEHAVTMIKLALGIIIDLIGGDFSGAWNKTKDLVAEVVRFWRETVENVLEFFKGLGPAMLDIGQMLFDKLKDGLVKAWAVAWDWLRNVPENIKNAFTDIDWFGIGKAILQGIGNGLDSMKDWVIGKATDIAGGIGSALNPANWKVNPVGIHNWYSHYLGLGLENMAKTAASSPYPAEAAASITAPLKAALGALGSVSIVDGVPAYGGASTFNPSSWAITSAMPAGIGGPGSAGYSLSGLDIGGITRAVGNGSLPFNSLPPEIQAMVRDQTERLAGDPAWAAIHSGMVTYEDGSVGPPRPSYPGDGLTPYAPGTPGGAYVAPGGAGGAAGVTVNIMGPGMATLARDITVTNGAVFA